MEYSLHIHTKSLYSEGLSVNFYEMMYSVTDDYFIANCAGPDEILHYAALYLGLHSLPNIHLGFQLNVRHYHHSQIKLSLVFIFTFRTHRAFNSILTTFIVTNIDTPQFSFL